MAVSNSMMNLCFVIFFNAKHAKFAKILVFSSRSPASFFEGGVLSGSFSDLEKSLRK
jgi:hypothetical protein